MEDRQLYMDLFGEKEVATLDESEIIYPEDEDDLRDLIAGMKRKDAL